MSAICAPNHPATFNGHFQPITDSIAKSVRANQYGYVKTPSFFQCGGINSEKNEDFEVELITDTALNNTDSIYSLSGKIIALNDGSTPILSYFQDSVVRIGATGQDQPDFTNKSIVTSLGMVISQREVANSASDSGSHLEVIVAHCDWDGQVSSVSVTSGHQIGQTNTSNPSASTSSPIQGRKSCVLTLHDFSQSSSSSIPPSSTKFSPKTTAAVKGPSTSQVTKPTLPMLHPEATTSSAIRGPPPEKLTKGKSKATSEYESDSKESPDNDESKPSDAEAQHSPPPKTKRGRPRKKYYPRGCKKNEKELIGTG
ncbi:hypothetical protein PGTUg99_034883 [Puccinia graminis f. sp. tritici]|uniref:Uncharacterized protein n=1 Tax=Puccinia graminis f. sp. tritici TaxID=56615 RepID=A0A5B0RWH6_PUCGR|nr:hypothetical protein PGTUg99_034883 [Puccinia graminis f. sp. tritici]